MVFVIWLALCGLTAWGASQKGRNPVGRFFLSLILSPLIGSLTVVGERSFRPFSNEQPN